MGTDTTQVGETNQTSLGVKIWIRAKGNTNIGCKAMLMDAITGKQEQPKLQSRNMSVDDIVKKIMVNKA